MFNFRCTVHTGHCLKHPMSPRILQSGKILCFAILYEYCVHYMHPFVRIRLNALLRMHARALGIAWHGMAWHDFDK